MKRLNSLLFLLCLYIFVSCYHYDEDSLIVYKATSGLTGRNNRYSGCFGDYWISNLCDYSPDCAYNLYIYSEDFYLYSSHRFHGGTIRAVCK